MPTYLNCCFCPSQSFPTKSIIVVKGITKDFIYEKYLCPANHVFYIEVEENEYIHGRCV